MVDPPRIPRAEAAARLLLGAVCAAVLIVPIFVGDFEPPGPLPPSPVSSTTRPDAPPPDPGATPEAERPAPPPAVSAASRRRAARLPLSQQAAQVLLVAFEGFDLQAPVFGELARDAWGGIVITEENALTVEQVGVLAGEAGAVARGAGRVEPLVVAEPNGAPSQPSLARRKPARVRALTRAAARPLAGAGVDLVFAPVADIGVTGGFTAAAAFSDDPATVAELARAAVEGWRSGGVLPAPAHFPGQGAASQDPVDGPATVGLSRDDLDRRELAPFRAALESAPAVVVSSAAYTAYDPVTPAALTPAITRKLLRSTLRFGGAAITDDLQGLSAATGLSPQKAAVAAISSGMDLVFVADPSRRRRVHAALVAAVRDGDLPAARLRDAAGRVLDLKARAGSS